jgi:hypothetical protein
MDSHRYSLCRTLSPSTAQSTAPLFSGLSSFPFVLLTVRRRSLWKTAPRILGAVLGEIVVVTPFAGWGGFAGSFVALAVALFFCATDGIEQKPTRTQISPR